MQQSINFYARVSSLLYCLSMVQAAEHKEKYQARIRELNEYLPTGDVINIAQSKPDYIVIDNIKHGQIIIYPSFSRIIEVQIRNKDMENFQEVYYLYTELKYEV